MAEYFEEALGLWLRLTRRRGGLPAIEYPTIEVCPTIGLHHGVSAPTVGPSRVPIDELVAHPVMEPGWPLRVELAHRTHGKITPHASLGGVAKPDRVELAGAGHAYAFPGL